MRVAYRQTSNIKRTLVGNKIVDDSYIACRRCSNYIHNWTPGFNILHKDNRKTRRETFKFRDLVHLY